MTGQIQDGVKNKPVYSMAISVLAGRINTKCILLTKQPDLEVKVKLKVCLEGHFIWFM